MDRPFAGRTVHPNRRTAAIAIFMAVVLFLYAVRLFQIQVTDAETYAAQGGNAAGITLPIEPTRGEILDRNMNELVVNTTTYTILFDKIYWPSGSSTEAREKQNDAILRLTDLLTTANESWNDVLPISKTSPYVFEEGREDDIQDLKTLLRLAQYATADNCMAALIERYDLQKYTPSQQRVLAGVQVSMELATFTASSPYEFAPSVSKQTSYAVGEASATLPGVNVTLTPTRSYVNGDLASHLIGTVGLLSAEEYEQRKEQGYSYNDVIGKFGVEQVMEEALRGTEGVRTVHKDAEGTVTGEEVTTEPTPGATVVLTLDAALQRKAQDALTAEIAALRAQKEGAAGQDVRSGSVVMLDVKTGGTLVCATWPNYELASYYENYNAWQADPDKPMFNRALQGAFAPGSTFKISVAIAALSQHTLTAKQTIYCGGAFTFYSSSGLTIKCMGHHGSIPVTTAISKSCNTFFCEVGRLTGIAKMNEYAKQLGLGVKTGIELGETSGTLAGPEAREAVGGIWFPADTSQAALGQSDNMFSPMQLATYAMTLANRGTRYQTHLVRAALAYDGTVTETQPVVAAQMDVPDEVWNTVHEGMVGTIKNGTAARSFAGAKYTAAAKTGTAQTGTTRSDHGVFIGYAPAENPEVAIAVVMENGASPASLRIARTMLDAYFAGRDVDADAIDPGTLVS